MFVTLAKQIRFGNKIPYAFFLDEATTFKIPDLESYPSELREYLIAFVMLTQSPQK
jgi:type IV secretory pathway TraG/TraD family ATPase VirD4